jgi:predicted ribosomally synthesized peptide with SipW-like signal peptide
MQRIALALFAIVGVAAAGVFATSAYFTDTVTQNNYTFKTSSADLKFGFCPGIAADCSGTAATLDSIDFDPLRPGSEVVTGPGKSGSDCLVVENKGDYALNLTSLFSVALASPDGMQDAFEVKAATADSACNPPGVDVYSWQSARTAAGQPPQPVGTLAPNGRLYVIISNRWNSAGNQNALQNGWLQLNTSITGTTE